mgnify:CR=1 FL=1
MRTNNSAPGRPYPQQGAETVRGIVLLIGCLLLLLSAHVAEAAYLPAPAGVEAIGGDGQVTVRWHYGTADQWPDLAAFRIYRSVDNGASFCLYDTLTWTGPYQPEYVDTQPSRGPYVNVYYVTAVATDGEESAASNWAAATPTSGGVYNPPCTGGPGGGDDGGDGGGGDPGSGGGPGGNDPGGPGGGDPGSGDDPGGGATCDQCTVLEAIRQALRDLDAGLIDVEDALWVVWSAVTGVREAVNDLNDYLRYPTAPLPTPPAVPIGPGYSPPPAPDLTPVMPQLGQRTGRPAPTVPTLYVPPDIPAPPALPDVQSPVVSLWGLPIEEALEPDEPTAPEPAHTSQGPLAPVEPARPAVPVTPRGPVQPEPVVTARPPLTPAAPLAASVPLSPDTPRDRQTPLRPSEPLQPHSPSRPAGP